MCVCAAIIQMEKTNIFLRGSTSKECLRQKTDDPGFFAFAWIFCMFCFREKQSNGRADKWGKGSAVPNRLSKEAN